MQTFKDSTNGDIYQYEIGVDVSKLASAPKTLEPYTIPEPTDTELQLQAIANFTSKTNGFIQARITAFNEANRTAFTNVHNCESYSRMTGYTHQAWCLQVWTWSVDVWIAVRAYQDTAITIPTDAEFQAVLDGVAF